MATLYVASTETFVGKSAVCVGLLDRARRDGFVAGYMKPVSVAVSHAEDVVLDDDAARSRGQVRRRAQLHARRHRPAQRDADHPAQRAGQRHLGEADRQRHPNARAPLTRRCCGSNRLGSLDRLLVQGCPITLDKRGRSTSVEPSRG